MLQKRIPVNLSCHAPNSSVQMDELFKNFLKKTLPTYMEFSGWKHFDTMLCGNWVVTGEKKHSFCPQKLQLSLHTHGLQMKTSQ